MAITKIGPEGFREQQHNKPFEITGQQMFEEIALYTSKPACRQAGPVQAGFVIKEGDWKYSSARDFCGMRGLVELSYS
ncbi:MAG: hypothetical protein ABI691_23920 [Ginsengibacter sp.]